MRREHQNKAIPGTDKANQNKSSTKSTATQDDSDWTEEPDVHIDSSDESKHGASSHELGRVVRKRTSALPVNSWKKTSTIQYQELS